MAKRRKRKTASSNYLDLILIPHPECSWSVKKDGSIVIDMIHKGFFHGIAQKFFHKPRVSHISLDTYGTTLWKALDGTNSVFTVIHIMEEAFPNEKERMTDRVITFLHTLQIYHFIIAKNEA